MLKIDDSHQTNDSPSGLLSFVHVPVNSKRRWLSVCTVRQNMLHERRCQKPNEREVFIACNL